MIKKQKFPKGWNETRVTKLFAELDARTDEEWIEADEAAALTSRDQVVIAVPAALLPDIRRLLAARKATRRNGSRLNGKATAPKKRSNA